MGAEIGKHFDRKAAGWDSDEGKVAVAAAIVRAVEKELHGVSNLRLLDYGAGTGLCSMALASRCSNVLAVDISSGMLSLLEKKALAAGIHHLKTLQQDLCASPLDGLHFDVILCAMTMHHVRDTNLLLRRFHSMLQPDGFLAIADLDREDGTFHSDPAGVYHTGFDRDQLGAQMMEAGFKLVGMDTVHKIQKTRGFETKEYPVLFATGRKRMSTVS